MSRRRLLIGALVFAWSLILPMAHAESVLVRGATVWTQGPEGTLDNADVLVVDGRIKKVGHGLKAPDGAQIIDASGKHVTPGLIDCHSHTAIRGGGNEGSNNITAEVRIRDVLNPEDINIYRQLAGGLTTAHVLHGSANSIGGQDAVIKLRWGGSAGDLTLDGAPGGIKFALGENPKRSNFRRPGMPQRSPSTRMGVMESIRDRFRAAQDYLREWDDYRALGSQEKAHAAPPRRDLQLEALGEILRGERLVHSHSYRQDEILALIRVADEFGFKVATFQHVLEGYKVADELREHGAGASTFSDWWAYKLEAYDAIPFNGALMHERGVLVSFNSDSGELARRMNLEAAKAVKYGGVDPVEALKFVTINAARQLRVDDRIGSLERGKDADFVIWSGHPLSTYSIAEQTWVDGIRRFDRAQDIAAREAVEQERADLIRRIKAGDKKKDKPESDEEDSDEENSDETADATIDKNDNEQEKTAIEPQPAAVTMAYHDRLAGLAGTTSIIHATVHSVSGGVIENGTVSFKDGVIVELGAGLAALEGAEVVDASGMHLYPGMIDANTVVGLTEIGSVAGSVDTSEIGDLTPNVNTALAVNPDSELIPVTRANGLTHVVAAPSGGLVSGSSSLIRLDGWTYEDLSASSPLAMHVRWPRFGGGGRGFFGPPASDSGEADKRRKASIETIRSLFDDARGYARLKQSGRRYDANPGLEAMLPVLDGSVPLIVHAGEIRQIKSALDWAEEENLRIVLAGSGDLWRVAERLAQRDVPVILTTVHALPTRRDEAYDVRYTEAGKLHEAGVKFCIAGNGSGFSAPNTRSLPYHSAMAAAFGLPRDEALRAVTLYPAQILGVGDHLGSIEVGKSASLILTSGDPLEIMTRVERVFIDGRAADPGNKHQRLYDRNRSRPKLAGH
jgi:imidazolonepropionase-like amidohydrolase